MNKKQINMEQDTDTPKKPMTVGVKIWAGIAAVGVLAGALAIVPQFEGLRQFVLQRRAAFGSVDLPGSYLGETWRPATVKDFDWLQDEWCYPALAGFRSRFRVQNGVLARQNVGAKPKAFVTEWVSADVFISNRGIIRLRYVNSDWPGTYVDREPGKTAEWRESERSAADDGTISSGKKRLVLSCGRCRLSSDGSTYSCGV